MPNPREASMPGNAMAQTDIRRNAEIDEMVAREYALEDLPNGIQWKKRQNQSQHELLLNLRYPSYDLFDTKITPTTTDDLLDILDMSATNREQCIIASQNLHGMRVLYEVEEVRKLHDLDNTFVHIDGMPIVALCKLMGIKADREHRVTLIDFIWPLLRTAEEKGWRLFYLGARPEVLSAGLAIIRRSFPNLEIKGRNGYFELDDAKKNQEIAEDIRSYQPQIVLVGMGMARQEPWILKHYKDLAPASFITVGACLEYIAGAVQTPPRWMGYAGIEWLFRLAENPRRFWHRYLVEPWLLLAHIATHSIKSKMIARRDNKPASAS
jgi:N-acetylglucosaminyldiphosphoundecaprenol N-acetyl-beta-D-mannosaminyltransferase